MTRLVLVCLAGAAGSGARYALALAVARSAGTGFPFGTLLVNCLGCLCFGFIFQVGSGSSWLSPAMQITLTTGFLGGFTTYSAFNHEVLAFFRQGAWGSGIIYMAATLFGCLALGTAGALLARAVVGSPP